LTALDAALATIMRLRRNGCGPAEVPSPSIANAQTRGLGGRTFATGLWERLVIMPTSYRTNPALRNVSKAEGIFHPYYLSYLGPAIGGVAGISVATFWPRRKSRYDCANWCAIIQ
jgi:hypothetical protein